MAATPDERYHELLNSGELYDSGMRELTSFQHELVERLRQYNATPETPEGLALRAELLDFVKTEALRDPVAVFPSQLGAVNVPYIRTKMK